jgi:hypothetical protein
LHRKLKNKPVKADGQQLTKAATNTMTLNISIVDNYYDLQAEKINTFAAAAEKLGMRVVVDINGAFADIARISDIAASAIIDNLYNVAKSEGINNYFCAHLRHNMPIIRRK